MSLSASSPSALSAQALQTYLHEKIPLSRAMAVEVAEASGPQLVLEAPLAPNLNHLGTAFGGSLQTLTILAGYAALWILMREAGLDGHVVVKDSTTRYRQPVKDRLRATCTRPAQSTVDKFLGELRRHRKARMVLPAVIVGPDGKPAVEFRGTFVAFI